DGNMITAVALNSSGKGCLVSSSYAMEGDYNSCVTMLDFSSTEVKLKTSPVKSLAFATKETKNANGLIEHMTEYLNIMAGKTSFLDRAPQMLKGRKFLRFMDIAAGLRKKALFPFSFTIAMKQFSNISNLPYHVKNPASVVKGLWDMKDLFKKDSKKSRIIAQSGFLNERYIDKFYRKLDNKISAERVSSFMLEAGDQLAANIIWFSAYEDAVRKKDKLVLKNQAPGKYADPILYADNITRQCVGGRGQGELPPILESKTVKAMFPFVVESMNSQHNFDDAVRKGDVLGVLFSQLIMASINAGLGALGLGAVGFDFVEAAADIFDIFFGEEEDGDDEEEEETLTDKSIQAAQRLGAELIESRWYAPILSLFAGTDAWQSLLGDAYDDNVLSNELLAFSPIADAMRKNDIREIFYGYVPGGAQIKRTKSFLQDMGYIPEIKHNFDDWFSYVPRQKISASYTDKGELRFPIKSTLGNHIKGVLFGEYATNEGMTYIDEERKPLSEERTALFNDMVKDGLDAQYIYDAINTVAGINKGKNQAARQRRAIMDMDLTPAQKLQLDTGILGENKNPVDYTSEDTFFETAYEKKQQNTFRLMALGLDAVTAEAYVNTVSKIEGEKDETGNPTDYSKREKRVDWINADKYLNNAQKAFLYRNYVINDDKTYKPYYVARALGTFSDDELAEFFPQFMKVEPDFYANGKTVPKSKNKNVRALANKLGLSQEQKDVYYYYFYTNSKEGDNAEAKILNKLYKKLTPEQKKDFVAWYEDNDKRVDEKALLKVLEGLN
ncbi:MAG: hypothetical protein IJD83_01450, partial [Clostridia bacterium]|nr:hypothetical protein [Clostridia bacterium]